MSWKEREWIPIVLLSFQHATIFMFYFVLNTIKSNFKTIWFVRTCKQDNTLIIICHYSVCVIYDLSKAMFTLYRIGFCSVSKVASIQCEQELMFCCRAEIVSKRSQCELKPYPSYNLQRSLLILKDHLPVRGSVAISVPIKCSDLTRTVSKTYGDKERSTANSEAEQFCSGAENASKAAF